MSCVCSDFNVISFDKCAYHSYFRVYRISERELFFSVYKQRAKLSLDSRWCMYGVHMFARIVVVPSDRMGLCMLCYVTLCMCE